MDYTGAGPSSTEKHNLYQIFLLFEKQPTFTKVLKISKPGSKKISLFYIALSEQLSCSLLGMDLDSFLELSLVMLVSHMLMTTSFSSLMFWGAINFSMSFM